MSTITRVSIGGQDLALSNVAYTVKITHGRSTVTDGPQSATCDLVLYGDVTLPELSQPVIVEAYGQARFTGLVSDIEPSTDPISGRQFVIVTCTGPVADLALYTVTPSSWPQETSGARAARILTAAGITNYRVSGEFVVLAQTSDPANVLDLLGTLASSTGAAVYSAPDGTIVFQDLLARAQRYVPNVWTTMVGTWADQSGTWADQSSPSVSDPVPLPPEVVVWQPTLAKHRGNIVNRFTIAYGTGNPRPSVTENQTPSQTAHKLRDGGVLDTQLATLAGATQRAENILERLAFPRWELGGVTILVPELTNAQRAQVLALECGSRVVLEGLPDGYPVRNWMGIVEGWGEEYTADEFGNEYHALTLALSDPAASYAALTWEQVTSSINWNEIPSRVIWADATSNELLTA